MVEVETVKENIKAYWDRLLPEKNKSVLAANRKRNWFFLFSALAFFCLTLDNKVGYVLGMLITLGVLYLLVGQIPSVWDSVKNDGMGTKLFYGLTAAGICLGNQSYFYRQTQKLQIPALDILLLGLSFLGAVTAFYFVYVCVAVFWRKMAKITDGGKIFRESTRKEKAMYVVLYILLAALILFAFSGSEAFSGTDHLHTMLDTGFVYDIIYTSDSCALLRENVYFALTHPQNDLRQPLFAVFASPLLGIPYLIGRLVSASEIVHAAALALGQLLVLLTANFMLARMLKLSPAKRMVFMLLSSCTYAQLLFAVMMEQYIVAYFWLIFCMYQICERGKPERMVLWGAGGSLLTSLILLPAMSDKHPVKQFKDWFMDMVEYGLEFVGMILVCCRFDTITALLRSTREMRGYMGGHITWENKLFQYTEFVRNCFAAPNAGINLTAEAYPSWQLEPVTALNWVGIGILVLCGISAVWNREKKSTRMAALWAAFSVVMLFVLGWGTAENGLILYALYFGWAFLVLLFQLAEKLEETLRIRHFACLCDILAAAGLLAVNIPAILEMIQFALTYYPA